MADYSFLEHPMIKKMHPKKLAIMKELMEASKNQPVDKALPLLLSAQNKLKSENLAFTKEESDIITNEIMKHMSQADKMKLEMLKGIIAKRKK